MRRLVCAVSLLVACGKGVQLHPELAAHAHDAGHDEANDAGNEHSERPGSDDAGSADAGEDARDGGTPDTGPETFELDISRTGNGKGQVASPLVCSASDKPCSGAIVSGSHVSLTALPDEWSTFAGWGGACSNATGDTCNLVMRGMAEVSARFDTKIILNASISGPGHISGDLSCAGADETCRQAFELGQQIVLDAEHEDGAAFVGWTGDCMGSDPQCKLTMDGAKQVSAVFVPYYTLSIVFPQSDCGGSGSVTGPQNLSCVQDGATVTSDSRCAIKVLSGSDVTLEGKPNGSNRFGSWSGPCPDAHKSECTLHMTSDITIGATFCNVVQ